jgi:hypothetical protein
MDNGRALTIRIHWSTPSSCWTDTSPFVSACPCCLLHPMTIQPEIVETVTCGAVIGRTNRAAGLALLLLFVHAEEVPDWISEMMLTGGDMQRLPLNHLRLASVAAPTDWCLRPRKQPSDYIVHFTGSQYLLDDFVQVLGVRQVTDDVDVIVHPPRLRLLSARPAVDKISSL